MKREDLNENKQPETPGAEPVAQNPNPRANENIRVRHEEPTDDNPDAEEEVGSEITDGEDA